MFFYGDPMKLRGLRAAVLLVVVALMLGLGLYYLNQSKNMAQNEIKSQSAQEHSEKAAPTTLKSIIAKNIEKQNDMVERVDFGEPLVAGERFYTEEEINNMTEVQFEELLKTTEAKLPKLSDIRKLPPAALHRTPAPIIQAGKDLGLLKEVLKVHESYKEIAQGFYDQCAKASDRPTPVRALCLTNLIEIKKAKGEKIDTKAYPQELINLAKIVTDL
jgi:hypothetical protein